MNLKENLLLTFLIQVLINGQDQQRTQRFFALATADIYIDTRQGRQGGMDKYCTTLPVLVWDERQKLQDKSFIFSGCGTPLIRL